ncbi:LCP family glycopolymer transferase [Agathobaculum sp.]|uniref:LCP family glycopolymer transferase n=1 Tax=Agathobaculum sp. TaxID=2048138 RepID=UPI002A82477D|nr:LCP family protein [Agathobaculum sp.]MDY3618213.1 LCP family protein [Agathobaculum sp.]
MSLKRLQRTLVRVLSLVVILATVFCLGLYAYRTFFGYNYDSGLNSKDLAAGVKADENITNIALFGLDTREGDTQSHSDCMMIVTVDNTRGKIKLISLMRDSLVTIESHGEDKLNSAYFLGGPTLAIKTINQNFGTDITDYIAVDFEQLVTIIDALDGVEIDVQDYELDELNRVIRDYGIEQKKEFASVEKAGKQKLDGVQALCYGRIRKGGTGDDWGRVERQSIVLQALFQSIQDMNANKLLGLMQKLVPNVTTSLSPTELAPLIVGAVKGGMPALEHTRLPLDDEWQYYGSSSEYILFNLETAADHIHEYIYNDVFPGNTSASHGQSPSPSGDDGENETGGSTGTGPLGGLDFDTEPTGPAGSAGSSGQAGGDDPASLAEEGGSYDPATGDYCDSEGDYYRLDENGNRLYYDQETYKAGLSD